MFESPNRSPSCPTVVARLITKTMLMYITCNINIALLTLIAKRGLHAKRAARRVAASDLDLRCGYCSQLAKIDKEHKLTHIYISTSVSMHASVWCVLVVGVENELRAITINANIAHKAFHCKNS